MRRDGAFESSRPWVIGAVLLCAVGTLGAVVVSATPRGDVGRAAGFTDVLRTNPGVVSAEPAALVAAATVAGLAALWWSPRRSWPWLLLAGVAMVLPAEAVYLTARELTVSDGHWLVRGAATAGAQLVLLGTLAAGLRLVHIGAAGAGAVLAGAGVGAQIFGAAADVWIVHLEIAQPGGSVTDVASALQTLLHYAMLAAAGGGALLAVALHLRYDGRPERSGPATADPAIGRRAALAGAVAAIALAVAATSRTGVGGFTPNASRLLLAAGLLAAALAGVRAAAGTAVAGAVIVGVSGPLSALIQDESGRPVRMWFFAALGVVIGAAAAFPTWRPWTAVAGCVASAAVLAVVTATRPHSLNVLALALLTATATAATAALAAWLARDALPPIVLGPLTFATVLGACGWLADWQGTGRRGPNRELFQEPRHLWLYTALLLAAAAAFTALTLGKPRTPRTEADGGRPPGENASAGGTSR